MLIKCLRIRKDGTKVEIDGAEYAFLPDARFEGAPHLCDVEAPGHIKKFLALDAYEPFDPGEAQDATVVDAYPSEGVNMATAAGDQPMSGDPATGINQADQEIDKADAQVFGVLAYNDRAIDTLSDEELRAAFLDLFGKNAHPKTSREKLIENIANKLKMA